MPEVQKIKTALVNTDFNRVDDTETADLLLEKGIKVLYNSFKKDFGTTFTEDSAVNFVRGHLKTLAEFLDKETIEGY